MRVTDAFLGEHAVFYAQFDWAETALEQSSSLTEIRTTAALIAAALVPHAQLENDLLFAAIEHERGPIGPILAMRIEHDEIEQLLTRAAQAADAEGAAFLLRAAIEQARTHFAKEEQAAFPLAEHLLDDTRLHELGALWAERRAVSVPA